MSPPPCDRFETEGLLQLERGQALDPHFDTCPDCLVARERWQRLGEEIASLGESLEPSADWQARTFARIEKRATGRRRSRLRGWFQAGLGTAAAAALVVVLVQRFEPPAPEGLEWIVGKGSESLRSLEAAPGDPLRVRAPAARTHVELRIYRDDLELLVQCSTEPPCQRSRGRIEASFQIPGPGTYQVLWLSSEQPLPAPTSEGLDADAESALAAGARIELGDEIDVR